MELSRKPLALANWKMSMTIAESLAFVADFQALVGESRDDQRQQEEALAGHLGRMLVGCQPVQVAGMAFVYEPEGAIGADAPAGPERVAAGCRAIREWIGGRWGAGVAESVRIIYGGSVSPEHAAGLLASPDVDGLGATRRSRDAATFAAIVRQIIQAKVS